MAQYRKEKLTNGQYYHIFSRSIAKFIVFNDAEEFDRFYQLIALYRHTNFNYRYSQFVRMLPQSRNEIADSIASQNDCLVEIVAYCLMPTHVHLLLKQEKDNGIAKFMARVLNSYSRYFNTKHKRNGPLWSGRFKSVLISHDEQLLHLTRYIHLNPSSADIVIEPIDWTYSSYKEYIDRDKKHNLCLFDNIIELKSKEYKRFVEDHKGY